MTSPHLAAGRGLAAGLAATLLLSVLARLLPGMESQPGKRPRTPKPPQDPFDPEQVRAWQERSWSPAASRPAEPPPERRTHAATPAGALAQPQAPGPEGLAEQFAFKVASGLFNRDITPYVAPAGKAVHLTYGSGWGMMYGILRSAVRQPSSVIGPLYGLLVWAIGPASLVPAMKLMGRPSEEPPLRTGMILAGHLAYGAALAETYRRLASRR